jgi:hypothetical protein
MRMRLVSRSAAVFATAILISSLAMAQVAVTTYHNDNARSGANNHETILTPANVKVNTFGKKATFAVQGFVYAQPLYLSNLSINGTSHNVVFIATEHDQLYAFDVNSGQQLWRANYLSSANPGIQISSVSSNDVNCTDLVPEIGITATPVIDPGSKTMFLVTKTKEYNTLTHVTTFYQTLHAVDVTTGKDKVPAKRVTGSVPGNGNGSVGGILTFDPLVEGLRGSLLIVRGQVMIAWASHCDLGTYHGWLMAFSESNLAQTAMLVDTANGYEGGFWGGGAGPATDLSGALYLATGNGRFDLDRGGTDYGDSILKVGYNGSSFTVMDYFTPWNQQTLDNNDTDLGSGSVVLLPDQLGKTYPHLLIQVGKEGTIDLVNRDNMGHFNSSGDSQIVQTLQYSIGGIWGSPAFWNNTAYFGGIYDHMKAFRYDPVAQKLSLGYTSESPQSFNFPGPVPSISANGNSNGIMWAIQADNYNGGRTTLHAYDATNLGTELYNSNQNSSRDNPGLSIKFATPTIADGHVFVGAENQVTMFGLL